MKETKFYIQKAICFLLTFCIVVATLLQNAYALSNSVTTEILLPSEALSDTAIVDYLRNTNKLGEFYKAQNAIKQNYDEQTAQYAARMLNKLTFRQVMLRKLEQNIIFCFRMNLKMV